MKKLILWLPFTLLATVSVQHCNAQYGEATLVVTPNGKKAITYKFLQFPNSNFSCNETKNGGPGHIDFNFSCATFKNEDGTPMDITAIFRTSPAGNGKFPLNSKDSNSPLGSITIDFNGVAGPMLMNVDQTPGSITITHYPNTIGDSIIGTFDATLKDSSGKNSGLYHVSGSFNIKRSE